MSADSIFTVGGTVQAHGGRYVSRQVDEDLYDACVKHEYAYVLAARQMGKSSLMVRTVERLRAQSVRPVIVDLSQIGVQVTPEAWYLGFLSAVEGGLGLDTDPFDWWEENGRLGFAQRLARFFIDVVMVEIQEPVVVFIDEIDTTLSLDFTDDFFATIRSLYNARSTAPALDRLSFVLIGVATPNDLMADPKRTPFNIGREMDVADFRLEEAMPLADGFDMDAAAARKVLGHVIHWTGGHPYLTQRLCSVLASSGLQAISGKDVSEAVAAAFFGEQSERDANLRFVQDMLTRRADDPVVVLELYRDVLKGRAVRDDRQSRPISHLKLSGVVVSRDSRLVIRNRVYQQVFDRKWLDRQMPVHWIKSVPPAVRVLVAASFVAVILLGVLLRQAERTAQAERDREEQAVLNAQLAEQIEIQDSLTIELRQTLALVELQRDSSETLRQQGVIVNAQLAEQFDRAESLRAEADRSRATTEDALSDTRAAQAELRTTLAETERLRNLAEERLSETREARRRTLTLALADASDRLVRSGSPELAALLARQAFHTSGGTTSFYLDPVFDSLIASLNALGEAEGERLGGPQVVRVSDGGVRAVAFSPDGRRMAIGAEGGRLSLVSFTAERKPIVEWSSRRSTADVRAVAFSPDSNTMYTVSADGFIGAWETESGANQRPREIGRNDSGIRLAAFDTTGRHLAAAGLDGRVTTWDLEGGSQSTAFEPPGRWIGALAFQADDVLLVGGRDGRIWRWETGSSQAFEPVIVSTSNISAIAVRPDGSGWVAGTERGDIVIVDPGQDLPVVGLLTGHQGPISRLAFIDGGDRLVSGSGDRTALVWDLDNADRPPVMLEEHEAWIWDVAGSTNGSEVATAAADRTVRIWSLNVEALANRVCSVTQRDGLSESEWATYVGSDFDFATERATCPAVLTGTLSNADLKLP